MLFTNAVILTMAGQDFENGFILVSDGKICAVGDMRDKPNYIGETIDLAGRTVTPGFVDAHCHLGLYEDGLGYEGDDLNEDSEPCTPNVRALDGVNPLDTCFEEARRAGVTSVLVSPGSANPVSGEICAMKTAGKWVDKMLIKQTAAMKFALGENPKSVHNAKPEAPATRMATAAIIREQLYKARRYLEDVDAAMDSDETDAPEYDAKCEALLPLLRGETAAHFHAHKAYDILTAIRIAAEFGLNYRLIHCTEGHLIADILAQEGAKAICGPLLGTRTKPELVNMRAENCALLAAAGVKIAISTDHPEVPVGLLASSAAFAVSAGLDKTAALRAITCDAAEIAGIGDSVGKIAVGLDADLLVFDEEPLRPYAQPQRVYIGGELVAAQVVQE